MKMQLIYDVGVDLYYEREDYGGSELPYHQKGYVLHISLPKGTPTKSIYNLYGARAVHGEYWDLLLVRSDYAEGVSLGEESLEDRIANETCKLDDFLSTALEFSSVLNPSTKKMVFDIAKKWHDLGIGNPRT